ncbi:MAG: HAMP domain-containing sensor histidine kinase [Methylobacter sp.]|nr:HAMP domain-containing sensor histidine kinase [Methylobacter sp.]MDP2429973.1 HAMP domain-containing sensor histidine kinase [Methylobacter sp.]MDP3054818.1 HAMP domain-containing sensor histidine kinase [Methylobacter sp.]MDP3361198.1 HAMP domain-containing sensor histidine kinase [Methylobacter sp.]MDZ4218675.1 HAMP domain-containing sensor histidine kinase [Methylobacter sp.]
MSNTPTPPIDFPAILASSVHDIKNSLTTLRALLSQLENSYQEGVKPKEFRQLEFETNRMNNCLMHLLTLYKIDLSRFSLAIDEHSVADIVEDVVAQQSTLLDLGNVELLTEYDDLFCYCDSTLISHALCTLVNNAQRYCRNKVLLSVTEEDGYIVFSIEDDGLGYPAEFISSDGETLHQLDLANGNTGLGLFFTKTIAQLHTQGDKQGFITTDNNSQLGGARFKLHLP